MASGPLSLSFPWAMTDLIALADAHCIPRKGSEHKLTEARVRELMPQVPGWELAEDGHALVKTYKFADYYRTMAFVNALAFIANREDHHPDLGVHYNRCVVRFSTHGGAEGEVATDALAHDLDAEAEEFETGAVAAQHRSQPEFDFDDETLPPAPPVTRAEVRATRERVAPIVAANAMGL